MSKQVDFADRRRVRGRSLRGAVGELTAVLKAIASQQGIDLQLRLDKSLARNSEKQRILVERLQESVVPLFVIGHAGRPERIGSCVLVRLDTGYFALTAAHVMREVGSAKLFAPSKGKGGKLLPLPPFTSHLNYSGRSDDLDVALLVLPTLQLGSFRKRVFLSDAEIDKETRPDDRGFDSFYLVLGYAASPSQVQISVERRIHQQSFHCATHPVDALEYLRKQTIYCSILITRKLWLTGGVAIRPSCRALAEGEYFRFPEH